MSDNNESLVKVEIEKAEQNNELLRKMLDINRGGFVKMSEALGSMKSDIIRGLAQGAAAGTSGSGNVPITGAPGTIQRQSVVRQQLIQQKTTAAQVAQNVTKQAKVPATVGQTGTGAGVIIPGTPTKKRPPIKIAKPAPLMDTFNEFQKEEGLVTGKYKRHPRPKSSKQEADDSPFDDMMTDGDTMRGRRGPKVKPPAKKDKKDDDFAGLMAFGKRAAIPLAAGAATVAALAPGSSRVGDNLGIYNQAMTEATNSYSGLRFWGGSLVAGAWSTISAVAKGGR